MQVSRLADQNPWWKHGERFTDFDPLWKSLNDAPVTYSRGEIAFERGTIYLLRGPRQVGKTAWIKQSILSLLRDRKTEPRAVNYLSCDQLTSQSRKEFGRAIQDCLAFAGHFPHVYLFLDEINYVKDWQFELKGLADAGKMANLTVVATGSSPALIKSKGELLPGRKPEDYFMKPLLFRDFAAQTALTLARFEASGDLRSSLEKLSEVLGGNSASPDDIDAFLQGINGLLPFKTELDYLLGIYRLSGGFPKAVNNYLRHRYRERGEERIDQNVYEDYVRFVLGDIQRMDRGERIARQILAAILKRSGSRYSYNTLSAETEEGVGQPTVVNYVELLADSFVLNILLSYDFSKKSSKPKGEKKIYFLDPLIRFAIDGWLQGKDAFELSVAQIQDEMRWSSIAESIVCEHLAVASEIPFQREAETFLWMYYDQTREIDFIYRTTRDAFIGIEVKSQTSPSSSKMARLSEIAERIMLTRDEFRIEEKVRLVPLSLFLAALSRSPRNL